MTYPIKLLSDDAMELVGQIIDLFEDFLEKRNINIANPEKEFSESPAIIYGTDYGELQCGIEDTFLNWGIMNDRGAI